MNDLIERYIYDVTKRLEESKKKDIENELRANIYDMLGDDLSEAHVIDVLKKLGRPVDLALEYKEKKSYVISPRQYDDYIKVLKIVLIVFIAVTVLSGITSSILEYSGVKLISSLIEEFTDGLFGSIFFGFTIVTVIFWAIDQNTEKQTEFDPRKLPKVPEDQTLKSRRIEGIIEVIMIVIFGSMFVGFLIANHLDVNIQLDEDSFYFKGNLLNTNYTRYLIPVMVVSIASSLFYSAYKIIKTKTSILTFAIYSVIDFISLVVATILTVSMDVFNPSFIEATATASNKTILEITQIGNQIVHGIVIFVWVIFIIEQIVEWIKLTKKQKRN
jgi:hypothetical protein